MESFKKVSQPLEHFIIESWTKTTPELTVGFSARNDRENCGVYHSMNMALHVGDNQEEVIKFRKELALALGFSFDAWTSAEQVHGNNIEVVDLSLRGSGRLVREDAIPSADGLLTNQPNILLTSFYADCVPLYFLDPVNRVIGLAHAGWKGTVLKIADKMVEKMVSIFHSKKADIKVAIGPAIGQCCYEVDQQVINQFAEASLITVDTAIIDKKSGHYYLDLKKINKEIMIKAGILPKNIEITNWCTSCNTDLFFSHRKEKGKTGRMASWIGFRKDE